MASIRNVVILSDYAFIKGGAEKVALSSAVALAKSGLTIHLFAAVGPVMQGLEPVHSIECLDQHDILSNPSRLSAMTTGIWNAAAAARLAKVLAGLSPTNTVIHAHQWSKALTTSVFHAVRKGGFEFVLTLHDYFIACPNGVFLDYPRNEICERAPLSARCLMRNCDARNFGHKAWRILRHVVQNKIYGLPSLTKHCIYVSSFSRDVLKPYLPEETRWYHVSNPSEFDNSAQVDIARNRTYLFVGRLSAQKGPILLAEAAKRAGVQAVFVGDGTQAEAILRTNPDATITGWLDRHDVLAHYRQARALVFPSLWYECQPLAVLEALSLGIPVIVSDRCAASEPVVDGVNGYRFRRGNVADLVGKIGLLQDDLRATELSAQAYHLARTGAPAMEHHVHRLINVYDQMLMRNNQAAT